MKTLIKNLNAWRKKVGLDYLVTGRMLKPLEYEGASNIPMLTKPEGLPINFPSVLSSNWQSQKGQNAQFFANYLPDAQEITIDVSDLKDVKIHYDANDAKGEKLEEGSVTIKIAPLSAVMLSYSK